jgi:hypothetical protein
MSTESENVVRICHQETTGECKDEWEELVRTVMNCGVCELTIPS